MAVLSAAVLEPSLLGQAPRAVLTGVVRDQTGAVVVGATLTLEGAGVVGRRAVSDAQGAYVFDAVPPGTYRLLVESSQFAQARFDGVTLSAGERRALPVTLAVRPLTDTVSVAASSRYTERTIAVGRTPTSRREMPQSVSVLTRERLDDQGVTDLGEALRYTTGVTVFDVGGAYTNYAPDARGASGDFQADGMNFEVDSRAAMFDLAIYDRIEVLRGPAGLFKGAGSVGMTTNLVRKRALAPRRIGGAVGGGSWGTYRAETDLTGSLTDNGAIRARVVAATESRGSYLDDVENDRQVFYGTIEFDLADKTTLSAGGTMQRADQDYFFGLPAFPDGTFPDVPRSTSFTADWAYANLDNSDYFLELEHQLGNGGFVRAIARRLTSLRESESLFSGGGFALDGSLRLSGNKEQVETDNAGVDAYASLPFGRWGLTHNVLVGVNYSDFAQTTDRRGFPDGLTANLFAFDASSVPRPDFTVRFTDSLARIDSYGTYGQLRIKPVRPLTLVGGGRLSWRGVEGVEHLDGSTSTGPKVSGEFTPYLAALFDANPGMSLYTSYAEVFQPQTATTAQGQVLPPVIGGQFEAGVKGELAGGDINVHAAFYRTVRSNEALSDPDNPGFAIPDGKRRAQGFEAEVSGQVTPEWSLTAGYAFTVTKILVAAVTQTGQPFSSRTPKHSINLWARYAVPNTSLEIGAGLRTVSEFFNISGGTQFLAEGYTVDSYLVGYRFNDRLRATLNIDNLFDHTYIAKVGNTTANNYFGPPRSFMVALRVD